ncbi:MAG: ATP-binding protein [Anaerolineales bacterium]
MFPRVIEKNLTQLLETPEILIVYGPRRVGKTTLLQKIYEQQRTAHPAVFYTLDDPTAQAIFVDPSTARLTRIFSELGFLPNLRSFLFLDEVQGFPKIDLLLKMIFDHFPFVKVMATSSSSLLLLQNLTDSLAGRKYFLPLLPLTLSEYTGLEIENFFSFPEWITKQGELNQTVLSFTIYGSYPEILNLQTPEQKQNKLRDIIDSILYKDIFLIENLKAPQVLIKLVALLAYQIGNLVNLNELAGQVGVSRNTVEQYISILEKYFLVFRLPPFERNLRSEINARQKIYFWDLGIRNAVINRFYPFETRDDKGALFENQIMASILKRNLYAARPFNPYFWQTYEGYEIDLILENINLPELWAFQITTAKQANFSRAFDTYQPTQKITINLDNAYQFCW